jgi:2-phospho-L-lactate/phosphoenolpyruvate guanylyltransferase
MILVPVKNFSNAKQRLSSVLNSAERHEFALAMLEDVLSALAACSQTSNVALVTGDEEAIRLAQKFSYHVIEDRSNLGESQAIAMATRVCEERGKAEVLVLPADIPLVASVEIDRIFRMAPPAGTVIVPSRELRGSNAILRRPASLFPLQFGNDSFQPHLCAARLTGKPCIVLSAEGIALDVDRPADLAAMLAAPGNTRAQQLAREWRIGSRLAAAAIPA